MAKKRIVMAIGHKDMGTNLPEQKEAVKRTAKVIADFIQDGWQVAIVHSNAPQVGMIHTAMNEFGKQHHGYSSAPMSVCSAMSQGYIGYDLQNGIRAELIKRGIYKPVSTVLTQVTVDPYDEAFYTPVKVVGRVMSEEEAKEEAIRLKAVMNDNTLNMLTKYVYKILGVYNLNCNYDINEEKCRCCNRKILNLKREENIDE